MKKNKAIQTIQDLAICTMRRGDVLCVGVRDDIPLVAAKGRMLFIVGSHDRKVLREFLGLSAHLVREHRCQPAKKGGTR